MSKAKLGFISVGARISDMVMPDRVIYRICFEGQKPTKDECLADYNADRARVAKALVPFGLDGELTCRRYSCYARTSRKKNAVLGYSYYAYGTIAARLADIDHSAVWEALNTSGARADMSIEFDIEDQRAAEDELIARAVEQARKNAESLAKASGTKIEGIKHISYNSESGDYDWMVCEAAAAGAFGGGGDGAPETVVDPEPKKVSCSVDIDWWIE